MLSIEEDEEEEEEVDDEEEKEEKKDIVKDEIKLKEKQINKKEDKKIKDIDDINNGSFMTQPPFKKIQAKTGDNNHFNKSLNINNNLEENSPGNNVKKIKKIIVDKISNVNKKENIKNNNIINNIDANINSDKKSSITVAVRVRPLNKNELEVTPVESIKIVSSNSLIVASDPNSVNKKTNLIKEHQFFFDYVFSQTATQEEVYKNTTQNLLPGIIEGYNATVFAYGATGSGKTYTMLGTVQKEGIMTRSIRDLFKLLNSQKNKEFKIDVSYIEIYNEIIRDLLSEGNVIDIHERSKRNRGRK